MSARVATALSRTRRTVCSSERVCSSSCTPSVSSGLTIASRRWKSVGVGSDVRKSSSASGHAPARAIARISTMQVTAANGISRSRMPITICTHLHTAGCV